MSINQSIKKQAIFLMGPTASGKTDIAIALAKEFPIEIISVDSAMIYKDMDIGTGKPTKAELTEAPHHLIDIISPLESYSVANFCEDAIKLMENAYLQNKIPLLVGGTMMYFKALKDGLSVLPASDLSLRNKLTEELKLHGLKYLHEKLASLDPLSAERINPNDSQRILRALEVNLLSNKTMEEFFATTNQNKLHDWEILNFAIVPSDRATLHERIKVRFLNMLEAGLVEEVSDILKKYDISSQGVSSQKVRSVDQNLSSQKACSVDQDLSSQKARSAYSGSIQNTYELPSMRCVGYRQVCQYLNNESSYDEMVAKSIAATRQLAKRQYTWLRSWGEALQTFDVDEKKKLLSKFIKLSSLIFMLEGTKF